MSFLICVKSLKITYTTIQIWRIVNGKVVDSWGVYDLDALKQLGVVEFKGLPNKNIRN